MFLNQVRDDSTEYSNDIWSPDGKVIAIQFFVNQKIIITYKSNSSVLHYFDFPIA